MRSAAKQYRVKVILPRGSGKKILDYLEAEQIEYEFYAGKIDFVSGGSVWQKIKRRFEHFQANLRLAGHLSKHDLANSIIQIDVAPWSGFTLLLYLAVKTNVFVTFHTAILPQSFWRQILLRTKFRILSALKNFHINASNLDVKKSLRPLLSDLKYDQIEIIYSSININEIKAALAVSKTREEIAEKYNFPADKKWICNVAQFIERKGCWVFLETIEILSKKRNDLFFIWLGTAPLTEATLKKIDDYDLGDAFRFLSAEEIGMRRSDLLTLWKSADLFVMPSFQEGLPVALIEAMALGKACIASNINAIPEAIKHLETGFLVAAGDSKNLVSAIEELIDNEDLRRKIAQESQIFVAENFEEKVTGRKMMELYAGAD